MPKRKNTHELMAEKGYIPASKVADLVGKSLATIYNWIDHKKVEAVRMDARWYVKRGSLVEMYRAQDPASVALLGLED
jgi:hypothetical protein